MHPFVVSAIIVMSIIYMEYLMMLTGLLYPVMARRTMVRRTMVKRRFLSSVLIICFSWFSIRSSLWRLELRPSLSLSYRLYLTTFDSASVLRLEMTSSFCLSSSAFIIDLPLLIYV
jgi:hypothetical protein